MNGLQKKACLHKADFFITFQLVLWIENSLFAALVSEMFQNFLTLKKVL